jgi:phosphate transport system substrate-binding protein
MDGADFVCPECGRPLTEIGTVAPQARRGGIGIVATVFLLLLAALFAWRHFSAKPTGPGAVSTTIAGPNVILRLVGSNTIGASMAPALAEAFLKAQGASDVKILPGANPEEKIVTGVLPSESTPSSITIAAHGSATAFSALQAANADIGMASRRVTPDEANSLASLGDMYSPATEHVVGLDGIAVIVNAGNPVSGLEKDKIMQIFTGEITDWSKVGPGHGNIKVYARDDKSGTYDTFKSLVLGGKPLVAGAQRFEDSNALSEAVAGDPNGIGFVGLPYIHSAKAIAVAEKGARPLQPNRLTVATEDYPLSRRLYLYTPGSPTNRFTRKFVEFALSKPGQDVVGESGFVAQNVVPQAEVVASDAPLDYRQLTSGAERLSLNFRFRTGKSDLDNKAIVDVDRVVGFITDLHYTGDKIMLFGFADSTGGAAVNKTLSLDRAKTVEDQFAQRGLKPGVVRGFGSDLPVASNDTPEGREKNRRVEIWVKK